MNDDFSKIHEILGQLKADYAAQSPGDVVSPEAPVTERDIVAEIRARLLPFCRERGLHVHCEMKAVPADAADQEALRTLPRIDVAILANQGDDSWLAAAKKLQDGYAKGEREARFSSVPVGFFHTAIEAKIQSKVADAKKDIDGLRAVLDSHPTCNCFFVLLNARGRVADHDRVVEYAELRGVPVVEHTSRR
jgi:hypothetical protein